LRSGEPSKKRRKMPTADVEGDDDALSPLTTNTEERE
jgi:hypothetical protein